MLFIILSFTMVVVGIVVTLLAVRGMSKQPLFTVTAGTDVTTAKRLFNFSPFIDFRLWQRALVIVAGVFVVTCIVTALVAFKQAATRLFATSFDLGFLGYLLVFQQWLPARCVRFWEQYPPIDQNFDLTAVTTRQRHFSYRWLRTFGLMLLAAGATSFFFI